MSSFSKAFKIAQPLEQALRILFTQICFQWLQNMRKELAKVQHSHYSFVSPLVLSLRLNLQAENITLASRALGSVRFAATDSLTDFVSPISGSVSSETWPFFQAGMNCSRFCLWIQCDLTVGEGKKKFGAEPLSLAFMCAHALALQNFTLEEKTFPWRQKGLGSREHLLIIILTGFWPWALFFLFSKHFLWVWKAEVKLSLQCICVWKECVKMESIKQE